MWLEPCFRSRWPHSVQVGMPIYKAVVGVVIKAVNFDKDLEDQSFPTLLDAARYRTRSVLASRR